MHFVGLHRVCKEVAKVFTVANTIQKICILMSHFPVYSSVAGVAVYGDSVSDSRIISVFQYSILGLEATPWAVRACAQEINLPSVKLTVYCYFSISIFFTHSA
jgi:hypothetical protein